ncbi:MAG: hypothetical protein HFG64_04200 [Lachnospiraceae bacterium]|nr:hypothetical protein [Lachnospiraceae bacterium]
MGVTHLCIWLANYLTGVRRRRCAVLEWNTHGDLHRLGGSRILEVDYYGQAGAPVMAQCLNGKYQCIITDFGEITKQGVVECTRCDRKIVTGSLSPWKMDVFMETLEWGKDLDNSWQFVAAFGSEAARKQMEQGWKISILRIPTSADAFVVTRADMDFFERLLGS